MDEGEYTVRDVTPAERTDGKEVVLLDEGMSGFIADAGEYAVGDTVYVEEYEDYRGNTSYRAKK